MPYSEGNFSSSSCPSSESEIWTVYVDVETTKVFLLLPNHVQLLKVEDTETPEESLLSIPQMGKLTITYAVHRVWK
jgi:hypothetical protein